jgi:flagellar basal-body rod modification protein FlgD
MIEISRHHPATMPSSILSKSPSTAAGKADASSSSSSSNGAASSNSSTSSATITANDFLQLLVTEMKNQDPTSTTDPNEYIDQLVQVNSLEQLIQINQDLGAGSSSTSGATGQSVTSQGNLSANISSHSKVAAAAHQVAVAMESGPNVQSSNPSAQLSNRFPLTLPEGMSPAVKP